MNNIITGKLYKRTNLKDGDGLYLPNYKILIDNIPLVKEDVPSKIKEYIDKIPPENFSEFINKKAELIKYFKRLKVEYITLDIEGFRSGSMG